MTKSFPALGVCVACLMPLAAFALQAFQEGEQSTVLASRKHEAGGVKVDLLEVKRDSSTVVTVRWRYRNETGLAGTLTALVPQAKRSKR